MRHLRSAAFHKAESQFRKRVQNSPKHEIRERERVLVGISQGAPKTVSSRREMARQSPAPSHGSGIHRMDDDRHAELFSFRVKWPQLWVIEIFVIDTRVADRRVNSQLAHCAVQFCGGE